MYGLILRKINNGYAYVFSKWVYKYFREILSDLSSVALWDDLAYEFNDLEKMNVNRFYEIVNPKLKPYKVYFVLNSRPDVDLILPFYFKDIDTYGLIQVSSVDGRKIFLTRKFYGLVLKQEYSSGREARDFILRNKPEFAEVVFREIGIPQKDDSPNVDKDSKTRGKNSLLDYLE